MRWSSTPRSSVEPLGRPPTCVALISAAGRLDVPGFVGQMHTAMAWWLAAHLPRAIAFLYSASGQLARRSPRMALKLISSSFPKVDREVFNRPDVSPRLLFAYVEATRAGGGRGLTEDMRVLLSPWGFDPAEIVVPVYVFHGRRDALAPPAHAERWIEVLADARPVWFEEAGHLGGGRGSRRRDSRRRGSPRQVGWGPRQPSRVNSRFARGAAWPSRDRL